MPTAVPHEQPGAAPEARGARRTVADLLLRHAEARATGTLTLGRGQVRKQLELRDGLLVAADSNLREEALGAMLVAIGLLDEQRLGQLLTEVKQRGRKMGTVLLELGWAGPADVLRALGEQVRRRAVSCLRWSEHEVTYEARSLDAGRAMEHPFELPPLVFAGLRETSSLDLLAPQFDDDGARIVRLAPRFERFRTCYVEAFSSMVPTLLADGAVLGSLVLRPEAEVLIHGLEALLVSGLAYFEDAAPLDADADLPAAQLPSVERAGAAASGDLSGLVDLSRLAAESARAAAAVRRPAQPALGVREEAALTAELLREYLVIDAKSPGEALGVPADAVASAIEAAFAIKRAHIVGLGEQLPGEREKVAAVLAAYERAYADLIDPDRRQTPLVAAAAASGRSDALGAELCFGEGQTQLAAGQPEQALARFAAAVAARPDQAAYHAWLGWTQFIVSGPAAADEAWGHLRHAVALDPDSAEAHLLAGKLAVALGDVVMARSALERTLTLDPEQPEAIALLVRLFRAAGTPELVEKLYTRLLSLLGERALPLRQQLARDLALLYEGELADPAAAGSAYAVAARLTPADEGLRTKVVELEATRPGAWRELAASLIADWQASPHDRSRAAALRDLLVRAGQADAAGVVAAAEVLRGTADEETALLAERQRPRALAAATTPFDRTVWEAVGYGEDDRLIEGLFAALAAAGILPPTAPEALGLDPGRAVAGENLPAPLRQALGHVSARLGIEAPATAFVHPTLGGRALVAHLRPPALLIGPELWASRDALELGYRLGRALALAPAGRLASLGLGGRALRPYLVACLALSSGQAVPSDAQAVGAAIMAAPAALRAAIIDRTRELRQAHAAVNLSAWARLLRSLAARIGLLVCGDLLRVGKAVLVEEDEEDLARLLQFAVALPAFDLRQRLGLTGAP